MTYAQHIYTRQYTSWSDAPAVLSVEDVSILIGIPQYQVRKMLRDESIPGTKFEAELYTPPKACLRSGRKRI